MFPSQRQSRRPARGASCARRRLAVVAVGAATGWACLALQAWGVEASLTVVAPDWVTDRTRVEARVAVRNPHDAPQTFRLEMYVDSPLGRRTLASTTLEAPAQGQLLHSAWFPTQGHAGANVVGYRVTAEGAAPLDGAWPMTVVASPTRAVPLITAAWFDPGAVLPGVYSQRRPMNAQDVRNEIDAAHAVGVDTLIITYPEYELNGWGSFYPSAYYDQAVDFDVVGTIFNQASRNGQRVIVGLGRGDDLYLTWNGFNDAQRVAAALEHDSRVAQELWDLYRDEPSFYGWYLTHEANEIGPASQGYYNQAVAMLREFAADKPVLISPSGTPIVNATILANSQVDVFAYQDAVGAGYVPYVYTYEPQQRIATLDAVYASYQAAHANVDKHLWSNLENWQMNGPAYANPYTADFARVLEQLERHQHYVDVVTSYEWFGFAEHPASDVRMGGARAIQFYQQYRDYYRETAAGLKTVNYVANAGFEQSAPLPGAVPAGWTFTGDGVGQRIAYAADTPTGTAAALRLDVDVADELAWLTQDVPVVAGAEYQFSAWAKRLAGDPSGGRLAAQVWLLAAADSAEILGSVALTFDQATWQYQAATLVAPAEATLARIVLGLQAADFGPGVGSYLVDGVALVGPAAAVPGDFDRNLAVDGFDLLTWQRGIPFRFDDADRMDWERQFGSEGAALRQFAQAPVPEPSAAGLLLCGVVLASVRRAPVGRRGASEDLAA